MVLNQMIQTSLAVRNNVFQNGPCLLIPADDLFRLTGIGCQEKLLADGALPGNIAHSQSLIQIGPERAGKGCIGLMDTGGLAVAERQKY